MFKRSIILLCFLAYSLTLVHSIVPHHHHDSSISEHHHHDESNGNHHGDLKHHDHHGNEEKKTVSHAFADAIHLPGSEVALHGTSQGSVQRLFFVSEIGFDPIAFLLALQLKPPDFNYDYRHTFYTTSNYSLFLLRAPPVV
jgi:hypothetical protein